MRRVNTRIVAATNRSLGTLVERGLFRADLFYRMSGVAITVPPLRRRKQDLLELAQHFLGGHGERGRLTMTPAAIDALLTYDWQGNVRESRAADRRGDRHQRDARGSGSIICPCRFSAPWRLADAIRAGERHDACWAAGTPASCSNGAPGTHARRQPRRGRHESCGSPASQGRTSFPAFVMGVLPATIVASAR
jgi:transcriptional regulator with GAF, ATPase, and Fis domain